MEQDQVTVATGRQLWRWCEVVMTIGKPLNSALHPHPLPSSSSSSPPAEREREREQELRWELSSKQGGRENVLR